MRITHFRDDAETAARYPRLFRPAYWDFVSARFRLADALPSDRLIANGNVVPRVGDNWLVIRLDDDRWTVPGGTRDPGEAVETTLRRELAEESGAEIESYRVFGHWVCVSNRRKPYRPHVPYPLFYRVVAVADVCSIGEHTSAVDGETVLEVAVVPLDEAVRRFGSSGRRDLAELYLLAASLVGRS